MNALENFQAEIAEIERQHARRVRSIDRWHRARMALLAAAVLGPALAFVFWNGGSR